MTIREAVYHAGQQLTAAGVPDARIDALLLLEAVCGVTRADYYARGDEVLRNADAYLEKVRLRATRIPLQQITGEQYFCGLRFFVDEHVLCPRPETELLVEEALKKLKPGDRFLDLCTGSGCIAISLLKLWDAAKENRISGTYEERRGRISAAASDLSEEALAVARKNAHLHGVAGLLELRRGDLYDAAPGLYDMIVSNPPYIASGEIGSLMEEVRDHEPRMALDGGADGLDVCRRIVKGAGARLKEGGWLITEIGFDQGDAVASMFVEHRYDGVRVIKDLSGLNRIVLGRKGID